MKYLFSILIIVILWSCTTSDKSSSRSTEASIDSVSTDSVDYRLFFNEYGEDITGNFDTTGYLIIEKSSQIEGDSVEIIDEAKNPALKDLSLFSYSTGSLCVNEWVIRNKSTSRKISATIRFRIRFKTGSHTTTVKLEPGDRRSLGFRCASCRSTCRSASIVGAYYMN